MEGKEGRSRVRKRHMSKAPGKKSLALCVFGPYLVYFREYERCSCFTVHLGAGETWVRELARVSPPDCMAAGGVCALP